MWISLLYTKCSVSVSLYYNFFKPHLILIHLSQFEREPKELGSRVLEEGREKVGPLQVSTCQSNNIIHHLRTWYKGSTPEVKGFSSWCVFWQLHWEFKSMHRIPVWKLEPKHPHAWYDFTFLHQGNH